MKGQKIEISCSMFFSGNELEAPVVLDCSSGTVRRRRDCRERLQLAHTAYLIYLNALLLLQGLLDRLHGVATLECQGLFAAGERLDRDLHSRFRLGAANQKQEARISKVQEA